MDKEQLKELAEMQSTASINQNLGEWYGWGSPVGLGIFLGIVFIALAVLTVAVRYAMLMR